MPGTTHGNHRLPENTERTLSFRDDATAEDAETARFSIEVDFEPDDRLGGLYSERLVPWAEDEGWTVRDRSSGTEVFYGFDDTERQWTLGGIVDPAGGTYDLGLSTACYDGYARMGNELSRLPDDVTDFVRERRPVEDLPAIDPDRGPAEPGGGDEEMPFPFDLDETGDEPVDR